MKDTVNRWIFRSGSFYYCIVELEDGEWFGQRERTMHLVIDGCYTSIMNGHFVSKDDIHDWLEWNTEDHKLSLSDIPNDLRERMYNFKPITIKCTCGGDKTNLPHSDWCAKAYTNRR